MPMTKRDWIEVDRRGRTSLARVRRQRFERYDAEELPDGTIILEPVVVVPVESDEASRARRNAIRAAAGG